MSLQGVMTGYRYGPGETNESKVYTLILRPVYGDSEENKAFWASTPSGELRLDTVNPEAARLITEHRSPQGGFGNFYVDITPAE